MQNEEADVVYKLKGKNEFFLIEHQSKVDYRMPFRILKYEMAIVESAIDEKECKKKDYLYPRVNAIVLYTGKQKWNVSKTFNEAQVTSILEKAIEFALGYLYSLNYIVLYLLVLSLFLIVHSKILLLLFCLKVFF